MLTELTAAARYIVRATGLLLVIGICAVVLWSSFFGNKPNAVAAVSSAWIAVASALSWPRLPDAWRRDPPTDKQIAYAEKLGIDVPDSMTKGQLSDLISRATGR